MPAIAAMDTPPPAWHGPMPSQASILTITVAWRRPAPLSNDSVGRRSRPLACLGQSNCKLNFRGDHYAFTTLHRCRSFSHRDCAAFLDEYGTLAPRILFSPWWINTCRLRRPCLRWFSETGGFDEISEGSESFWQWLGAVDRLEQISERYQSLRRWIGAHRLLVSRL